MTDVPLDGGPQADEAGEPVRELALLREEPSERFLGNVLDGINARQTGARAVELGWWGATQLVVELLEAVMHAIGVHGDLDRKE